MDLPYYTSSNTFTDASLSIRVKSKHSTSIYVTLSSTDSASKNPTWETKRYYVYRSTEISFNSSFINKYQSDDAGSSIRIKSDQPIAVLAIYKASDYVVATPVLPMSALSTQYALPSYQSNTASHSVAQILVVALNDSTVIRLNGYATSRTILLNQNETYVYQAHQDLSGTSVTSNNIVAIFTSVTKGYSYYSSSHLPSEHMTNFLAMQVSPFSKAAVHFIVPALPGEVKTYKVRIYASSEGARVEIHSTSDNTKHMHIYDRIYYEYSTKRSSTLEILSDNPIIVVQIAIDSLGRSMFMTNVPAVSQYLSSYLTDYTQQRSSSMNYIVTIPYEEALGLLVNGKPVLHNPELVCFFIYFLLVYRNLY